MSASIPPEVDRETFLRLLMRASAAAVIAAAAFVAAHPPDGVAAGEEVPSAEPSAVEVTRADLLDRLRQQRASAERTG